MASDFQRIVEATLPKFIKGFEDEVFDNSILLKKLKKKGRVTYGHGGRQLQWRVRKAQHALNVINDAAARNVSRTNLWTTATLEWVGYESGDMITEFERLKNQGKGDHAIFPLVSTVLKTLKDDMNDLLNPEVYKNSQASGNAGRLAGLEEMVQDNTADSDYIIGNRLNFANNGNDDTDYLDGKTYAGLNLDSDDTAPYYWSPVLINTDASAGNPIVTDEATNPLLILDQAIVNLRDNTRGGRYPDMAILTPPLESQYRDAFVDKENIYTRKGSGVPQQTDIGVMAINYSGVEIFADSDAQSGVSTGPVGYVLDSSALEYCVLGDQFIRTHKQADIDTLSDKFKVAHYGQLKIKSPRHIAKIYDYNVT